MSSKLQTSSAIIFDKLVAGDPYIDGALQRTSGTQKTSPTIVQNGIKADLCDASSASSISVYISKSFLSEHRPYVAESGQIVYNTHFIAELRRQLSGEITFNRFSPTEQPLYNEYNAYVMGEAYDIRLDTALSELDIWLVEEIQNNPHPTMTRRYASTNPWMKIDTREIEEI